MPTTDADLVRQCLSGYCDAYGELVQRHQDAVFNLLVKMTSNWHEADDLTQEAFIRAYRKLPAFDSRLSFKNWVMAIAVNLTKNRFRSLFRRRRIEEEAIAMAEGGATPAASTDPRMEAINQAMGQLSENLRAPLVLRHMEGCSYEEIARILGIGVSAAKMRVMRARDELVRRIGAPR